LNAIRALSMVISEFGAGFPSLGYLSKLPIFKLKVDGMFVVDMAIAQQGLPLVSMIIKIIGSLQLKIVGKCVEAAMLNLGG
jgi:EAL domain-containing protein (putative c-di-GMP-specific phosphodiesterase class I)